MIYRQAKNKMEISKGGDNGEAKEEFEIPFARSLLGCKEKHVFNEAKLDMG